VTSRGGESLCLQVPSDGNIPALRKLLDRLDDASAKVERLSIHTPDLDDVFFAFTSHPDSQKAGQR
jgi:ABC-2 type transport system ATP-binding protein